MSFLSALALVALALSVPLVLLYFLKVRRREADGVEPAPVAHRAGAIVRPRPSSSGSIAIRCCSFSS